jgi:hypothetical protein
MTGKREVIRSSSRLASTNALPCSDFLPVFIVVPASGLPADCAQVGLGRTTSGQFGILSHWVLVPSRISLWYFQGDQSKLLLESDSSIRGLIP